MANCSISIIIPAYNVEKYLKAALDSIKEQTELPDEVIVIDDGSTDRTLEVAKSFEFSASYQVVSTENGGQGNARNLGVSLALSEYVHFFDSDDLLTKNFIKSIKEQIQNNHYPDIVLFSGTSFNDCEYRGNRWVDYSRGFSGVFKDRAEFLDQALAHNALFCSPCLYVSKKSLWGPQSLEFGSNFFEDEAVFFPLLFSCSTYVVIDDVFFLRRNRDGSTMTMTPNAKHINGVLNCKETALKLYGSKDLDSRERWHIRKRLESHCISYIVTARRVGLPVKFREIVSVIVKCRSIIFAVKAVLYGLRADQSATARTIGRAVRRLGAIVRG